MTTILRNQLVPQKQSFIDYERIAFQVVALKPVDENGMGDCIETNIWPENIRRYVEDSSNYHLIVRQVDVNKWWIFKAINEI